MIGRLVDGRYRIGRQIARGGMATVYEAADTRLNRPVALKVMHAGLGDDQDFAARFVREAHAAAGLTHPNVVAVYDQGDADGVVFLAMELIVGRTLRDVVSAEAPMGPARALALIEPIASALAAAHRSGIIHRDIKPENVLVADDGRIKVADFGLARAVSAETQHTATGGVLIGTVSYLAPELVVDGKADTRADVYALGVVLYELLTGVKPHQGETPIQVAYRHVHEDVPPPSRLMPGLPPYVDALVARCTARDRSLRPADAGVLLHQIHRVVHALTEGVQDDPELTVDLAPMVVSPDTTELPQPPLDSSGSTPVAWDAAEMAALFGPATAGTTVVAATSPKPPVAPSPPAVAHRPRPTRRRRGPLMLALALLVAASVGGGAWWFGWARYTATPGVLGLTEAAATERLSDLGFQVGLDDPVYSDTVAAGEVVRSSPGPGDRLLEGDTVTLVISLGEETYAAPRVRGLSEDQAQDALLEVKLEFGSSTERWSEKVPAGQVITSDPKPGTTLRPGASVDLVLSKGRRPIRVGSWAGTDAGEAQAELERRGLKVDRSEEVHNNEVDKGDVVSHTPDSGTLFRGDTVKLVVSKGPVMVKIPDGLRGFGIASAIDALEDAGFNVKRVSATRFDPVGIVLKVEPGSGELAPRGSTVTLYVA